MEHDSRPRSAFDALSPKQTFVAGIVGGIMTLCTIGFFVLLGVVFTGQGLLGLLPNAAQAGVPAQPTILPSEEPTGPIRVAEVTKDDNITGAKKPKVTLIEYSDFECPFCSRFHPTMKQIMEKYGNDVAWVFRHFPLTSIHPKAVPFAHASECAAEQGKFWEMADILFERQAAPADEATVSGYAKELGLNVSKFSSCFTKQKYADKITADSNDAQAAGGRGTPHTILLGSNGETIPISGAQPFEAIEAALKPLL